MPDPSLTETLADWLVRWRDRGLPPETLDVARTYVLDWLGSALAGTATGPGRTLLAHAGARSGGPCSIVGGGTAAAEVAALVNGGLSHIVEMDDLHRASVVHPGAVVIPAALAVAEAEGADGSAFLSAVVAGYEVAIRVGEAVGKAHYRYFHNTSTCGVFGAAAAAAWLMELDRERTVWSLGSAGTQASGLWEFNADGSMSKHLHTGRAASAGVLAAALASGGLTGARRILEGERGLFAATAPDASPGHVIAGLPEPGAEEATPGNGAGETSSTAAFRIAGVSLKPHASCRHTHAPVDAALILRERLGGPGAGAVTGSDETVETVETLESFESLDSVEIDTYSAALELCDTPDPRTPYEARFSLQYCVASALLRGRVGLTEFTPESIDDPVVRRWLPRVECRADPEIEAAYPDEWRCRVRLVRSSGEPVEAAVDAPRGDPENPLSAQEIESKFRELVTRAGHDDEADVYLEWIRRLGTERGPIELPAPGRSTPDPSTAAPAPSP